MQKLTVTYISNNLWISKNSLTNLYYVGYKEYIVYRNISHFSLYNNKILAVKHEKIVFIHFLNKIGTGTEDALTLICTLNDKDDFDFATIKIDDICYNIDKNCNITAIKYKK